MAQKPEDKYKLSGDQKAIVIQMLADFRGNKEILKHFNDEYLIDLTSAAITYYKKNYEEEIIKMREKLMDRILAIPIANKFYRVELRQKLIADIIDKGLWQTIKNKYGAHKKGNHGEINTLLDSVHKELDPEKLSWTDPSGEHATDAVVILPVVIGPDGKPMIKKVKKEDDGKSDK